MDGGFDFEAGSIYDFMETIFLNTGGGDPTTLMKIGANLRYLTRRFRQINTARKSRRNVAHHYDLDGRLYALFLDSDRQYSCAYFEDGDADLDDGAARQEAAPRGEAPRSQPGMKVLDIGSGWGGLGLYLADRCGVDVTGVTLSEEQHAVSNRRAKERGLSDRVRFLLQDYRNVKGPFDRIVSVGMFEHVGVNHYRRVLRRLPRPAGAGRRRRHPFDRPLRRAGRHQCLDPEIHLPRRLHPRRLARWFRRSRRPASRSPTSRSCACTMRRTLRDWRERFLAEPRAR